MKKYICTTLAVLLLLLPQIAGAEFYYFHDDHLGGSSVVTDQDGDVTAVYDYMPYGETYIEEVYDEDFDNSYKFTDQEEDSETGLYYYGARYYNPSVGGFYSQDPAVYDERLLENLQNPQALNSYSYVLNNPVKYTDPSGEYVVETGEIEEGDTEASITQAVNDAFGITTTWGDIATISYFEDNFGTTHVKDLIGECTRVGTDFVADITGRLDYYNDSFAQYAVGHYYNAMHLAFSYWPGGVWDLKSSGDPVLGADRTYKAFIYHGELIRDDAPGNINFGYVSGAVGVPLKGILWGANFVQKGGVDDPYDQQMIRNGYNGSFLGYGTQ